MNLYVRKFSLGVIAAGILLAVPMAQAIPIYQTSALGELTGSRQEGNGVTTSGNYDEDALTFTISWVITGSVGDWHYAYTFSGYTEPPAISHFILDLTDDCVEDGDCVI